MDPIKRLERGFIVDDFTIYSKKSSKGRFVEEFNTDIHIKKGENEARILNAKIFYGRKPHYLSWVEIFNIQNQLDIGEETIYYYDSTYEKQVINLFSQFLSPDGRIFIEYYSDPETLYGLQSGFPAAVTRLGYILLENNFTWFKDWYFPEGFMEGGQKLQGEKTSHEPSRNRQLTEIKEEIEKFLQKTDLSSKNNYLENAAERAYKFSSIKIEK